jgi:hypothetical protein
MLIPPDKYGKFYYPPLSFGVTSPAVFQVTVRLPACNHKVVKFPDLLAGLIPSGHLPGKVTPGLGDAMVWLKAQNFQLANIITSRVIMLSHPMIKKFTA